MPLDRPVKVPFDRSFFGDATIRQCARDIIEVYIAFQQAEEELSDVNRLLETELDVARGGGDVSKLEQVTRDVFKRKRGNFDTAKERIERAVKLMADIQQECVSSETLGRVKTLAERLARSITTEEPAVIEILDGLKFIRADYRANL